MRTLTTLTAALLLAAPVLPTAAFAEDTRTTYLSDLTPLSQTSGWGPVEKDRSNGESASGDGRRLTLNRVGFDKGLGVHSHSDLRFATPTGCSRFDAVVGVDDEVGRGGRVDFEVFSGDRQVFASGQRTGTSPNLDVSVAVTPGQVLRLVVSGGGDGSKLDHADWADARLTCTVSPAAPPPVTAPAPVTPAPVAPAPVSGRDFGSSRAFWEPIGSAPRLDARSEAIRQRLAEPGAMRVPLLYAYGTRIYKADASTPRYRVNVTQAGLGAWGDNDLAHELVPIPDGAQPNTGSDGKLLVVDTVRRRVYDMWQARRNGSTWDVQWGGVYDLDGDGSSRNATYGSGPYSVPWSQPLSRGTGSGLSSLAGTVKMSEIEAGVIPHALTFTTDMACGPAQSGEFRWPATTTDGWSTGGTCIPQGARIQLDPRLDLAAVPGITKAELAVGRALQTYGAYANDNGNSRMSFNFEAPQPGAADPYKSAGLLWDYYSFDRLPWGSLRVLSSWDGS